MSLEAFCTAVEKGSFSAAARAMGKAQSRVSTAIVNLEDDLGVTLFDRSGKFPVLTDDGEKLLLKARNILRHCDILTDKADRMVKGEQVLLRLAVDELLPTSVLGEVLEEFAQVYPQIELEVLWGAMGDVATIVESGRADVGIDMPLESKALTGCSWRMLAGTDFCGVAAKGHPLTELEVISPADLRPHRQMLAISRGGNRLPEAYRFGEEVWECEDSRLIRELVRRGVGWAAMARYQIAEDLRLGRLVELPISFGECGVENTFYFVWSDKRRLTEPEQWLADRVATTLTALCGG